MSEYADGLDALGRKIVSLQQERDEWEEAYCNQRQIIEDEMRPRIAALEAELAALPAQEPVAWMMRELCRFFAYAYRAGHEDTCEAVYTHVLECDADTYHQDSVVEYLTDNGMSAAPPDLAARVEELEAALRNLLNDAQHSEHHCGDEACPVSIARAVLAKETQ